jgi:membrane-bound lytic murein transglycosylase A
MKRPLLTILLVLPLAACRATPDYGRPLEPGQPALQLVALEALDLPIAKEWAAREEIVPALERSIAWTRRRHAEQFFPMAGIEHARALASLERFRDLLLFSENATEFERSIRAEFDAYASAGWDSHGGGVFFTGYCTPLLRGSLVRTPRFRYPLYAKPPDLEKNKEGKTLGWRTAGGLVPFPTRASIERRGLLENRDLELAWLEDPIDAYIAHVNGSAFIELPNGDLHRLGYSAKNGRAYASLGKALIEAGTVPAEEMNLDAIRKWASSAPTEAVMELMHANESYVFFQPIMGNPHGSLDVEVTAERSIATDKTLFPRGALVFVDAELPGRFSDPRPFRQFLFDQDTGGAIQTAGRADIYFGIGDEAEARAGNVKAPGQMYYFFLKSDLPLP